MSAQRSAVFFLLMLGASAALSCDAIRSTDAWIREPPPVAGVAAGYLRLENLGDRTVVINRITSSCCAGIAMHETIVDGDQVRMSPMETLVLMPHEVASFEPGAAHLMLISPSSPLHHGDVVEIEFFCLEGGSLQTEFDVLTVR